ncbi:hypothetical protein ACG7TL_006278 [Trametes sanguinea]
MQSCAVLVPDEERDWVVAAGIEVGGVSLPSLRRLFEIAVGAGDKVILPTKKPSPAPTLTSAQATAESPSRPAETKAEPTEEKLQESAHVTKTLGYHIDTPALAPFLGRAPKKRCIHVRANEDEPVDIEDTSLGSGLQARRIWRKPYAHRNIARRELDEIIPPDEVSTDDRADQPAHAIHADGRREGSVSRNSPALQMLSGTRFHINARVQVADYSLFLPPTTSPSYSLPIASILRKFTVTCVTDPPPPTVAEPITILEPPFVVTSTTDKPFLARLTFTWAGSLNPPTEIEHWVDLDPMHYANPALGDEQVFDVELDRSTELLPVPPDLREHNPQDMLTAETSVTAEPDKAAEVEEVVPEPDYSVKLRSLLPQFPMTQKDIKGRFSARLPYSLANNPAQLRNMCYGRRKAIEMARARALRDAYSQLISEQQDTEAVPLTTLDVYHWLEDEGFYPRSGVNGAKQDSQKSEAAKSSRRQRGPGALSGDAFCRTCGLHRAYHPNVVDEDVKPVDIKPSALGAAVERGLCMAFNGEDGAPTRRPIFDVDALLKFAPTDSEIDAAQEVPYGLSRAIFVAPTSSSPGADMSSSLTDLVSVADPMLVVAIQRITGLPRLGNEAVEDRSEESATPFMLTTLPRSEAAAELAPSALLAIALKEFVRHLVGRGIDALRQDEAALRVATGRHDRARRPPAAGGAIPPRRLLTPSHVLRGVARYARTGLTGSALRVCLGRLGERCAILDDDPRDGAIHIPPGLATIQGVEEGRGDGDVPGEKDGGNMSGTELSLATTFNKDNTFGAAFAGFAASSICLGVLSTQAYTYFKRYPLDKVFYKALVIGLWLIEVADQALIAHAVYTYLVSNWGVITILLSPPVWSLILQITFGVITGTIVKINFALRVWRFSKQNIWVTGLIVLLTFAELAVACVYTVKGFQLTSLAKIADMKVIGSLSLGLGMATDVVIAAALCFFLRGLRTGHRKDDSVVNSLIIYAISTGGLTSVISLTTLILYNFMPDNFIFMAFYFVLSKVYANSFLAALNTRRVSRGRGTDAETNTMPTFLMVGKVTQRTVHIDPENQAESSMSPTKGDSKNALTSQSPSYAEAW